MIIWCISQSKVSIPTTVFSLNFNKRVMKFLLLTMVVWAVDVTPLDQPSYEEEHHEEEHYEAEHCQLGNNLARNSNWTSRPYSTSSRSQTYRHTWVTDKQTNDQHCQTMIANITLVIQSSTDCVRFIFWVICEHFLRVLSYSQLKDRSMLVKN